jgi:hypothetical protein
MGHETEKPSTSHSPFLKQANQRLGHRSIGLNIHQIHPCPAQQTIEVGMLRNLMGTPFLS